MDPYDPASKPPVAPRGEIVEPPLGPSLDGGAGRPNPPSRAVASEGAPREAVSPDGTSAGEAVSSRAPSGRRTRRPLGGAAVFAAALGTAAALVVLGAGTIAARASETSRPPRAPLPAVETLALERGAGYTVERAYAARVEPARETELAFETGGTLRSIAVGEGDTVAAGAVVARLDTRLLEAERERLVAARAALDADDELAALALERQGTLERRGFAAGETLDEARLAVPRVAARIAEADAALAALDVRLDKSVLRAPFDAVVGARSLDEGATVGPGAVVLALLERGTPRLRAGLPPARAAALSPTARYRFRVGERSLEARLLARRSDVDVATRTVSVLFEPIGGPPLFFGELGELALEERVEEPLFEVPLGALAEGEEGLWSLLEVVDDDGPWLRRIAARVVHVDGARAFVDAALDEGARVVAGGRHRVVAGERVRLADGLPEPPAARAADERRPSPEPLGKSTDGRLAEGER